MFTKLKNAFLGRNRMSKKERAALANFLVVEFNINPADAHELVKTGTYKEVMETYR